MNAPSGDVPYPASRLVYSLVVMFVVVVGAVAAARSFFRGRLLAELATTLGVFLGVVGSIIYTVAFRGLRPWEVTVAWVISGGVILWFVLRLDAVMMRPLDELQRLGDAIRRGEWAAMLSDSSRGTGRSLGVAPRGVAELIAAQRIAAAREEVGGAARESLAIATAVERFGSEASA